MAFLNLQRNFKSIETWEEGREALDYLVATLQDFIQNNPQVIPLVDPTAETPQHRRGDVATDLTTGTATLKYSDGATLLPFPLPIITFTDVTGEITDAQHGNRAGGTLHPVVTTTVAGFMSAADKVTFNAIPSTYLTTASAAATYATIANLALKAPIASPTFTGLVTLPAAANVLGNGTIATTQSQGDGSNKVATTSYVDTASSNLASTVNSALALKANLASPTFTGTPTLPSGTIATTQSASDNSTKIATTAYVFVNYPQFAYVNAADLTLANAIDTKLSISAATTTYLTISAASSTYAPLASPTFTGTPSLPAGTTGVTQATTVGNTTLATTAYVKNLTATSARAGIAQIATTAEVQAGTDATVIVTPATLAAGLPGLTSVHATTSAYGTVKKAGSQSSPVAVIINSDTHTGTGTPNYLTYGPGSAGNDEYDWYNAIVLGIAINKVNTRLEELIDDLQAAGIVT